MAERVRLGIVGLGSVSQRGILPHLAEPDVKPMAELVGVCDVVDGRAKATAEKYDLPYWYVDYDEMLANDYIDAIVVATPIPLHFEQAMAAVRAGKHVHVNKTMTTTKDEADQLLQAVAEAGVKLVASPGQMFRQRFRAMKKVLDEGHLDKVFFALHGMAFRGHEFEGFRKGESVVENVDPTWYYKRGGGPMYDMGVYCLHAVTGLLGPVKRVTAMSAIAKREREFKGHEIINEMDDNTLLLLDFGEGTFGYIYACYSHGGTPMSVYGYKGSLVGGRREVCLNGKPIPSAAAMPYHWGRHSELPESHVYSDIFHLVDCILTDRAPIVTGEHARHVIEVIEKGYLAAATGETQTVTTRFTKQPDIDEWGSVTDSKAV